MAIREKMEVILPAKIAEAYLKRGLTIYNKFKSKKASWVKTEMSHEFSDDNVYMHYDYVNFVD